MAVDTDTTEARGLLMPNLKPKLPLLPPLKLMPNLKPGDTVDTMAVDTDTVDTTDTLTDTTEARGPLKPEPHPKLMPMLTTDTVDTMAVDTDTADTTEARGPLMLKPHPKLMLTTDMVGTTVVDTDTVDTTAVDTVMADSDIMVELLLKQTNKTLKLQLSGSSHSKFFQFGYNAKFPSPLFFFET